MSETVHYRGTLRLVSGDAEDTAKKICEKNRYEKQSYQKTWIDCLVDEGYGKYVKIEGRLYYVSTRHSVEPDEDIMEASTDDNSNSIQYEVRYYNGGCGFSEALEEAVQTMREQGV